MLLCMKCLLISASKKYCCISCDICFNVISEDVSDKCKSQDKVVMCRDSFYKINGNNSNHLGTKNLSYSGHKLRKRYLCYNGR